MGVIKSARRYTVLVGATAAVTALAPASCPASPWAAPQTLSATNQGPAGPRLAGDSSGDAIVVWQTPGAALRYAMAPAGRAFGPSRQLAGSGGEASPVVAMDDRGEAVVAWTSSDHSLELMPEARGGGTKCCDRVHVALIRRDGTVRRSETLTPRGASAKIVSATIAADGSTISVLYSLSGVTYAGGEPSLSEARLLVRSASSSGRFGRAVILGPPRNAYEQLPGVLHAQAHSVSVTYATFGSPAARFEGRTIALHESVLSLSGRSLHARVLVRRLAVHLTGAHGGLEPTYDGRGDLAMLLETDPTQPELNRGTGRRPELVVATSQPGFPLQSRMLLTVPQPVPGTPFYSPAVAVSPSGRAMIAWSAGYEDDRVGIAMGRLPDPSFRLTAVLTPVAPNRAMQTMALAVNNAGQAVLAFQASGPEGQDKNVTVILRASSGHFTRPFNVAQFGENETYAEPEVVIDAHGRGVVTWLGEEGLLLARRFRAP